MTILNSGIKRLQKRWPQSFLINPRKKNYNSLIVVPGVLLPKGYNKTICTILFLDGPLTEFWVDLPDLLLEDGTPPKRSCSCGGPWDGALPCYNHRPGIWDGVPGFDEWKQLRLFLWQFQMYNPKYDNIYTSMMSIRYRLNLVA
jgi:hypothetical protein